MLRWSLPRPHWCPHRSPTRGAGRFGVPAALLAALCAVGPAHAQAAPPADGYQPTLSATRWGWRLQVPVLLTGRAEDVAAFPVDSSGDTLASGAALSPLLRLNASLDTVRPLGGHLLIHAEYEQDLPTGTFTTVAPLAGAGMPGSQPLTTQLRKAWAMVAWGRQARLGGGFMTSHWGLGLVANDGAHGWTPGSADFTDPRGGDLVLRGFVGTGPLTDARVVATVAFDKVEHDDLLLEGDTAYEAIASVVAFEGRPSHVGLFVVYRRQQAADGRSLDAVVVDPAGRLELDLHRATLTLEAEGALVLGSTTFGATADVPVGHVLQLGGVLRATLETKKLGGVVDLVYASGDSNLHDAAVTGFHADPNFETGLLLFRYVQAAQSARGVATASNPQLVGAPPPGIERLPTRGGLTDAVVLFPRFFIRPVPHLEAYGGVLFAAAPARNLDPFNTDLAGGSPRNALGGDPGSYWGTEVDLGLRYRFQVHHMELSAGAEGGVLFPGTALRQASGAFPPPVYGARLLLGYRL